MKKNDTLTLHLNVKTSVVNQFDTLYKGCRRRFVENAMRLAISNPNDFDKIFFMDMLNVNNNLRL